MAGQHERTHARTMSKFWFRSHSHSFTRPLLLLFSIQALSCAECFEFYPPWSSDCDTSACDSTSTLPSPPAPAPAPPTDECTLLSLCIDNLGCALCQDSDEYADITSWLECEGTSAAIDTCLDALGVPPPPPPPPPPSPPPSPSPPGEEYEDGDQQGDKSGGSSKSSAGGLGTLHLSPSLPSAAR